MKYPAGLLASLWGAAVTVGGFTAATKVASLLKDSLVASRFGNGPELDAFLLALALPTFLVNVAAGTMPAALTPTYITAREQHGAPVARLLAASVLRSSYWALAVLALVTAVASFAFAYLPGSSLAPASRSMLPWIALTLAPYTLLQGVCATWSGLVAAERGYAVSAIAPVAQPIAMAVALLAAGPDASVGTLVAGLLVGTVAQGAILARALLHRGLPLGLRRSTRSNEADRAAVARHVQVVRWQYLPTVASACLMSATTITDQTIAAWLPPGSVSALNYGGKVTALLLGVASIALSTTLLPHLSQLVAREEWAAIRKLLAQVGALIVGVTIPATLVCVLLAQPVVRLLYERGAFTPDQTALVASVQSAYLLQLPVHLLGILYVRLISALRVNRFLTISSAICVVANIVFDVVLMRRYGVAGIAFATSAIYAISCVLLGVAAYRTLGAAERATASRRAAAATNEANSLVFDEEVPCASAA